MQAEDATTSPGRTDVALPCPAHTLILDFQLPERERISSSCLKPPSL